VTRPSAATDALEAAFRSEWASVLGALVRRTGDLSLAEEATQEAYVAAAESWPRDGPPEVPGAWLMRTAWRRALDQLRHRTVVERAGRDLVRLFPAATPAGPEALEAAAEPADPLPDDGLRLLFQCCHPSLGLDARVALTLRLVGGLTTEEIARAFLVEEPAMAQRLVRAKRKVRQAVIPFDVPGTGQLAERVDGVLAVLYLVFNEGYAASGGSAPLRTALCAEAIRLARLLHALMPSEPEVAGLLALCLLHHARAGARVDDLGRPVRLADQDRGRWDHERVAEGVDLLDAALADRRPGPYQVQAAIAALHAQAWSWAETDWPQIAALYAELARRARSPVVEVNRAVAVGMADGPRAGLALLDPLLASGELAGYAPLHAARADLLGRVGQRDAARVAWSQAIAATHNGAHRAELERRAGGGR